MTSSGQEVLVVEDEPAVSRALVAALQAAGYRPRPADCGRTALELAAVRPIDIVLLDLGLPDMDGLGVLEGIRAFRPAIPVIVVSGRHDVGEKVAALDAGADDYVTKPYDVAELLARMRVTERGGAPVGVPEPICAFGDVVVDFGCQTVTRGGHPVAVSPLEFRVLRSIARRPGALVALDEILDEAWGPAYRGEHTYVHTYVRRLRKKLERDPSRPRFLISDRGRGYRLDVGVDSRD